MKIFPLGVCAGAQRPLLSFCDPIYISETIRARKLKFYTHLDGPSTLIGYDIFFR